MQNTEDFSALRPVGQPFFQTSHDGFVHNPLGAASYVFEKELAKPLLRYLELIPPSARFPPSSSRETASDSKDKETTNTDEGHADHAISSNNLHGKTHKDGVALYQDMDSAPPLASDKTSSDLIIHIGAQPNNSPHAGTIVTFTLAFILARLLQTTYLDLRARAIRAGSSPSAWVDRLRVCIQLDLVDTAPDSTRTSTVDGIVYQYSHRSTGAMQTFLPDYYALLDELSAFVGGEVEYGVGYQEDLMRRPAMRDALRTLLQDRMRLAPELAPQREALAIRSACPVEGCGIADKHGVKNMYTLTPEHTQITFTCPEHGAYTLCLEDADDRARVELNTPLRNLARALVYIADTHESRTPHQPAPQRIHMRVTGADYSGWYQEQLFFRQLALIRPLADPQIVVEMACSHPLIFYSPLITDWSGAKLSKSLYVKDDAYKYMDKDSTYLLEYKRMVAEGKDRTVMFRMVQDWVQRPLKLFRNYSVDYLHKKFLMAACDED